MKALTDWITRVFLGLFFLSLVMATSLEVGSYTSHLQFRVHLCNSILHHFQTDICLLNSLETLKHLVAFFKPNINTPSTSFLFYTGQMLNSINYVSTWDSILTGCPWFWGLLWFFLIIFLMCTGMFPAHSASSLFPDFHCSNGFDYSVSLSLSL